MTDALILAGGVAKGAFGAGVLSVLLGPTPHVDVRRIVAASSGALNGAFLASAIRSGTERGAGERLRQLWIDDANFVHGFHPNLKGLLGLRGFSDSTSLLGYLRTAIHPSTGKNPVDLRLVVTATAGTPTPLGDHLATTFERVLTFHDEDFDDLTRLERLYVAITASSAFPLAYLPVDLDLGPEPVGCYDGGLVDNAPIAYALLDPAITRVFVITPFPAVFSPRPVDTRGFALLEHLADILINERLFRDLEAAYEVNRALGALEARLDPASYLAALEALGWSDRRRVTLVEMRPPGPLEGSSFAGLFHKGLREKYVEAGAEVARAWLAR